MAFFLEALSQAREHRRTQLFSEWDSGGEDEEPDPEFALDSRLQGAAASLKDPEWLAATAPDFIAKVARQATPAQPVAGSPVQVVQQVFRVTLEDAAFGDACQPGLRFTVDTCLPRRTRAAAPPPGATSSSSSRRRRLAGAGSTTPTRRRSSTPDRPSSAPRRAASAERLARLAQPATDRAELTRRNSEQELQVLAARSVHKTKLSKEQAAERVAKMEAWESARQAKLDDARARKQFADAEEEESVAPQQYARNNILMSESEVSDVVGRLATPKRSRPGGGSGGGGGGGGGAKSEKVGGESNAAWSRDLRGSGPAAAPGNGGPGRGRVVAEERRRKKKGGGGGSGRVGRDKAAAAEEKQSAAAAAAAIAGVNPGGSDDGGGGGGPGSIFDKLTDSSGYTGAHRERFDKRGRGRGKLGRTSSEEKIADISQIVRASS